MNVLIIMDDALRPDHLGCHGYRKNTSPTIDRVAEEGVRFENVIATASHTLPPVVSILTGQSSGRHGIVNPAMYDRWKNHGLWKDAELPLHALRRAGYRVDGELVMRWSPLGFERDTNTEDEIFRYFEEHRDDQWFFYAEPYPTHLPYNPPDEYVDMFKDAGYEPSKETLERLDVVRSKLIVHPSDVISKMEAGEDDPIPDDDADDAHKRTAGTVDLLPEDKKGVLALYDGELRVFDDLVARYMERLQQLGILDDTLVIITSDHGEELMERGYVGHCSCNLKGTLYDESIKVPLIMRYPKKMPMGKVIKDQVSQIDIMPTICDVVNSMSQDSVERLSMDGESLLPLITGQVDAFDREAYAETTPAGWQALCADKREIFCVRTNKWKLILNTDADRTFEDYEGYDLEKDPEEKSNIFVPDHPAMKPLKEKLEDMIRHRCSGA